MYGRTSPEPRYWKALVVTALFLIPLALFARAFVRMPDYVFAALVVVAALAISSVLHLRIRNDWRAQDTMKMERFDRR